MGTERAGDVRSDAFASRTIGLTGTTRLIAEELAAAGAAADDDLITIEDGRKVLAVDYVALKGFGYANLIDEWTLWRAVKRGRSGRVTVIGPGFEWRTAALLGQR